MSIEAGLASWFATQLPEATEVRIGDLDRNQFGYSAETLFLTLTWRTGSGDHRRELAIRVRPAEPGLLPPYDLELQFKILRGLEPTAGRAPRVFWYEPSGELLGRDFYVMERLPGTAYEGSVPEELTNEAPRVRRMCEAMVEQLAAIHTVDLAATGLDAIADGRGYLGRELDHWETEIRRVQREPLPDLERLLDELRRRQPEQSPTITLVHGDAKPGNFAYVGGEVTAVFDWEMATVGDPLADVAWAEAVWTTPASFTHLPGALSVDELVTLWEKLTGITTRHREWYLAFQLFKMTVIMLVGGRLFDDGYTEEVRFKHMGSGVPLMTERALATLSATE